MNYFLSSEIYVLYPYVYLNSCHNRGNILLCLFIYTIYTIFKYVIEANIEERIRVMESRIRRRKQLLYELKETRRYWKLKKEALDRNLWRIGFGRVYEHS